MAMTGYRITKGGSMKMKKHVLSLLLTFIILTLFTGCYNLSVDTGALPSPEKPAASDGFCCVVSGRVSTELDATAMPASAARQVFPSGGSAAGARTALPSLNLTGEVTITAKFYDTTAGIPDVTGTYDTENKTFSVPLTKEGTWTIFATNSSYSGATTVTITRDTLVKNDIALKMKPDMSTLSGTGTISLPVSIEEGTGINKIAMTFTDSGSTVHTPDITLTSTTGTLNKTGVAAGAYSATIRAYDTAGALVFQCTESLLVLPGETTNNWVISSDDAAASPYLSIDEAGVVQFKITKACLENFARTSYYAAPYGDDTEGDGSQGNPFLTLKKAVDTIMLYNDGVSEYTIFITDDITYDSDDEFSISLPADYTKDLKVKLTSDSTTACTVNANGLTNVLKVINSSAKKCILTVENVVLSGGNGGYGSGIYIFGNNSNITATKLILNSGVEISNSLNTYTISGIGISVSHGSFEMNDGSKITGSDYSLSYDYFMGGGGLYLLESEAIINGGEISGFNFSTTNSSGRGAAIYASQSNVIMNGGRITDNTISGSASKSGTIIYLAESGYIMNGGTISNNSITGIGNASGGAFYISDVDSSVTLNSGNISNNAVKGSGSKGGAIYHGGGTLTINGGSFFNNSAENGGALYSKLSNNATELIVSGGYFFANTATKGAGMYLASSAHSATLKGAPVFSPADDIYLEKPASGSIKPLNIDGALLKPFNDYVATITPGEYSGNTAVLTGTGVSKAYSLFSLKDTSYAVNSEGKLILTVIPNSIPDGASVAIRPNSSITAEEINAFMRRTEVFTVNLDLTQVPIEEIKNIDKALNHVDTLILPGGTYGPNLFGYNESQGGGLAKNIKKVVITGDITGNYTFENCTGIEEVIFEEGCTFIEKGMFSGCTSLTKVTLPSTLTTIEWLAFQKSAIQELTIPASVTLIKNNIIDMDSNPNKIIFEDTEHTWSIKMSNGAGDYFAFEMVTCNAVDVSNPEENANKFRGDWNRSNSNWWIKNE